MALGKSGAAIPRRDDESPLRDEVIDATLPRKSSKLQAMRDRTRNRHRWTGREYLGAWENSGEGTRQNSTVTSGEGAPLLREGLRAWSGKGLK